MTFTHKEHRDEFKQNEEYILNAVENELAAYRLFVYEEKDKRRRERIECAIIQNVYTSKESWADLVDGCMAIRGRANYEMPIIVNHKTDGKVYGLIDGIEI